MSTGARTCHVVPCLVDLPVTPPLLEDGEPRCPRRAVAGSPSGSQCLGGGRACFLDQAKHGPPERRAQTGPARFWPDGHGQ